jgi:uncharacterized protein (DUF1697 family)
MTVYVALLRAINVGGTGRLLMNDLRALCESLGLEGARTYIQSGNVVFASRRKQEAILAALEKSLQAHMGRRVEVAVRSAQALQATLAANPFPQAPPAKVMVFFSERVLPAGLADAMRPPGGEQIVMANGDVFVYYPDGMGRSKLRLPAALASSTARNLNTLGKLAQMAREYGSSAPPDEQ